MIRRIKFLNIDIFMVDEERTHLIQTIRHWGSPISDAILNGCKIFSLPGVEGIIGYHLMCGVAIVMGDPVCALENRTHFVNGFHQFCKQKNLKVVYAVVSKNFAEWALQNIYQVAIEFGEELSVDPQVDPRKKTGDHAVLIRKKIKRALSEAITIHEHVLQQPELEKAMEEVGVAWLKGRHGAQIYVSPIKLFSDRLGKRWFYAQKEERIIGVAALHQLQARQGWLLNHLLTIDEAPPGTSELLIISILEKLAQENYSLLTFGIIPGNHLEIKGLGKFSTWLCQLGFKISQKIFRLQGRKKFWEKFQPHCESSYLLFSQSSISIFEVFALLRALNVSPFFI
jgi:lysylphosphatidylglycerol synthetase-like protein (DUF2156 family)